jgi:hypothetical protein
MPFVRVETEPSSNGTKASDPVARREARQIRRIRLQHNWIAQIPIERQPVDPADLEQIESLLGHIREHVGAGIYPTLAGDIGRALIPVRKTKNSLVYATRTGTRRRGKKRIIDVTNLQDADLSEDELRLRTTMEGVENLLTLILKREFAGDAVAELGRHIELIRRHCNGGNPASAIVGGATPGELEKLTGINRGQFHRVKGDGALVPIKTALEVKAKHNPHKTKVAATTTSAARDKAHYVCDDCGCDHGEDKAHPLPPERCGGCGKKRVTLHPALRK